MDQATATTTPTSTPTSTETSIPSPTATYTATPPPDISVQAPTECYGGPGETYDVVMTFDAGDQAEIFGRDETGDYWIIKDSDGEGGCWIKSQTVTTNGELGYIPYVVPPPTPTPAIPAAPENVSVKVSCEVIQIIAPAKKPLHRWEINIKLSWEDQADNETGYEIYKDGKKIAHLPADTTEYLDWFAKDQYVSVNNHYTIQAFNQVGTSMPVKIQANYTCPKN